MLLRDLHVTRDGPRLRRLRSRRAEAASVAAPAQVQAAAATQAEQAPSVRTSSRKSKPHNFFEAGPAPNPARIRQMMKDNPQMADGFKREDIEHVFCWLNSLELLGSLSVVVDGSKGAFGVCGLQRVT